MREPKRIPQIIKRLQALWTVMPELRLGQLIGNIVRDESTLYYIEDDELIKKLEKGYKHETKRSKRNDT